MPERPRHRSRATVSLRPRTIECAFQSFLLVPCIRCRFVCCVPRVAALAVFTDQGNTIFRDSSGTLYPTNLPSSDGFNITGRSASLADIDNDGDLDLLFQGSGTSSQKLFRNNNINVGGTASNTFTDVTSTMWPAGPVSSQWSAAWGDYDGDGKVDVFIGEDNAGVPRGRLMRNTGSWIHRCQRFDRLELQRLRPKCRLG